MITKKYVTVEMMADFNKVLESKGSIIRLYKKNGEQDITTDIKIVKDVYLDLEYQTINPTKKFYGELENFFLTKYGIELIYNNTGSCFWAK